tara:strand:- start:716 stop:1183 length:468 start_codon:yes stop_codon:yes gene_type:complete
MARKFRCKECGTGYTTPEIDAPPSPNWADGHVCTMDEVVAITTKLTYEERIRWFVSNYYETGMEYLKVLESFRKVDLEKIEWYNEVVAIPKYRHEVEPGFYKDSALDKALVKKIPPCIGHDQSSQEEEERENRMKIIGQNGNSGIHYREEDHYNG